MIEFTSKIRNEDHGEKRVLNNLKQDIIVRFGWCGSKARKIHRKSKEPIEDTAFVHEFGAWKLGNDNQMHWVPQRSVIAGYYDENESDIFQTLSKVIKESLNGKKTIRHLLRAFASKHATKMKARIRKRIGPPLHDWTISQRDHGGTIPLYDTKELHDAIDSEVEKK